MKTGNGRRRGRDPERGENRGYPSLSPTGPIVGVGKPEAKVKPHTGPETRGVPPKHVISEPNALYPVVSTTPVVLLFRRLVPERGLRVAETRGDLTGAGSDRTPLFFRVRPLPRSTPTAIHAPGWPLYGLDRCAGLLPSGPTGPDRTRRGKGGKVGQCLGP